MSKSIEWDDMSPEQQRAIEADHADFEVQLGRTDVDLRAASPRLHEIVAPKRGELTIEDDVESYTMSFTVDFSGILATLRQLPDGVGTAAFVSRHAAHGDQTAPAVESCDDRHWPGGIASGAAEVEGLDSCDTIWKSSPISAAGALCIRRPTET